MNVGEVNEFDNEGLEPFHRRNHRPLHGEKSIKKLMFHKGFPLYKKVSL